MGHVHPPNREATRAVRLYSKPTMTVALVPCSPDVCTETLPLPPTARRGHRRAWEAGMEQDQTQCEAVPVPLSQTMQPWFGCKQPVPLCGCPGNPQGFSVRAPMGNVPSVPPPPAACSYTVSCLQDLFPAWVLLCHQGRSFTTASCPSPRDLGLQQCLCKLNPSHSPTAAPSCHRAHTRETRP